MALCNEKTESRAQKKLQFMVKKIETVGLNKDSLSKGLLFLPFSALIWLFCFRQTLYSTKGRLRDAPIRKTSQVFFS